MPNESIESATPPTVPMNGEGKPRKIVTAEEIHELTAKSLADFGCRWLLGSPERRVARSPSDSLHTWSVHAGDHVADEAIRVEAGDSCVVVGNSEVQWHRGSGGDVSSRVLAAVIRGVAPSERTASLAGPRGTRPLFVSEHAGVPKVFVVEARRGETVGVPGGPVAVHCVQGEGQFVVGPDHDPHAEVPMRVNDTFVSFQDNQLCVRAFATTRLIVVHMPSANSVQPRG